MQIIALINQKGGAGKTTPKKNESPRGKLRGIQRK